MSMDIKWKPAFIPTTPTTLCMILLAPISFMNFRPFMVNPLSPHFQLLPIAFGRTCHKYKAAANPAVPMIMHITMI